MTDGLFLCGLLVIFCDPAWLDCGEDEPEAFLKFEDEFTVDMVCTGDLGVWLCDEIGRFYSNEVKEVLLVAVLQA